MHPFLQSYNPKSARGFEQGTPDRDALYKLNFMLNPESYFDYFTSKLNRESTELTGDITPNYSGLSIQTLEKINCEFKNRGVTVFPIFLMRDPVYHLQSVVRMRTLGKGMKHDRELEVEKMKKHQGSKDDVIRSSYQKTLSNAHTGFGRDNVYVQLYEDLFTQKSVLKLSEFLNLDLEPAPSETKPHVSKTCNSITNSEYDKFRDYYKPVYDGWRVLPTSILILIGSTKANKFLE